MILTSLYEDIVNMKDGAYTIELLKVGKNASKINIRPFSKDMHLEDFKDLIKIVDKYKAELTLSSYGTLEITEGTS